MDTGYGDTTRISASVLQSEMGIVSPYFTFSVRQRQVATSSAW